MKTCAFVFGERAEKVIASSRFFIQPGHLLFPRDVGFCSALNGARSAYKYAEKDMPSRRNSAHKGSRGGCVPGLSVARLKPSKRAERKTMEAKITDVRVPGQVLKELVRGLKFTIRATGKSSAAGCVASLISKASTD